MTQHLCFVPANERIVVFDAQNEDILQHGKEVSQTKDGRFHQLRGRKRLLARFGLLLTNSIGQAPNGAASVLFHYKSNVN